MVQEKNGAYGVFFQFWNYRYFGSFILDINQNSIATYKEIKELSNHPEKLLIDVRQPEEIFNTGKVSESINIPLGLLKETLQMAPEMFKEKYGREKPTQDDKLIFMCRSGFRSGTALKMAMELDYKKYILYYKMDKNFKYLLYGTLQS